MTSRLTMRMTRRQKPHCSDAWKNGDRLPKDDKIPWLWHGISLFLSEQTKEIDVSIVGAEVLGRVCRGYIRIAYVPVGDHVCRHEVVSAVTVYPLLVSIRSVVISAPVRSALVVGTGGQSDGWACWDVVVVVMVQSSPTPISNPGSNLRRRRR